MVKAILFINSGCSEIPKKINAIENQATCSIALIMLFKIARPALKPTAITEKPINRNEIKSIVLGFLVQEKLCLLILRIPGLYFFKPLEIKKINSLKKRGSGMRSIYDDRP